MSFIKAILVGHVINQGRKIYVGRHACLTKENNLSLLQSAIELLQIATAQFITKGDGQLLQIATAFLLQSATRFITSCDRYYKVRQNYYKLRQLSLLQRAMDSYYKLHATAFFVTKCDTVYYKLRQVLQSARHFTNCDGSPPISKSGSSTVVNRG